MFDDLAVDVHPEDLLSFHPFHRMPLIGSGNVEVFKFRHTSPGSEEPKSHSTVQYNNRLD